VFLFAKMSQKQIACYLLLAYFYVAVTLSPGLAWLIVGTTNLDDPCVQNEEGLNLASWLMVIGIVQTIHAVLVLLFVSCNLCTSRDGKCELAEFWHFFEPLGSFHMDCASLFWHFYILFDMLFMLAWSIAGIVELVDDHTCRYINESLVGVCIWAVVFGFIFGIINMIKGCCFLAPEPESTNQSDE
jgi:hypothetical protein